MANQLINYHEKESSPFLRQHRVKLIMLSFWALAVSGYWWLTNRLGLPPDMMVKALGAWFAHALYGPLLFILFFTFQPLVFFPSALMAVMSGYLYGMKLGFLVAVVGANGAGVVSYVVGRFFGTGLFKPPATQQVEESYVEQIRNNSFETILIMHLIFLPYDLVNYMAGFLRVDWKSFILATFLGSLPGTLTFVLFGASFEGNMITEPAQINFLTLGFSLAIMITTLILSRYLKSRRQFTQNEVIHDPTASHAQ